LEQYWKMFAPKGKRPRGEGDSYRDKEDDDDDDGDDEDAYLDDDGPQKPIRGAAR
jgi:hypothetical protein